MFDAEQMGEARHWLVFAQDDLRLARAILTMPDVLPSQACWHAQQAGEKALQAVLIAAGVPLRRTHDLVYLGALVPPAWNCRLSPEELANLGRWAVDARYPDASGGFVATLADAREAVALAEGILASADEDLANPPDEA